MHLKKLYPANKHIFKVNNWNIWTRFELCSKFTIKAFVFDVVLVFFFVNFEDILQPILVLLLLTLNMHLFAGMAVSFIFFGVCYIFLFDKIRKSKSIYLHIPVFYKNFCRLNLGFFKRKLLDFLSGHFFKTFFGC